jgi:hypothetical protein
MGDPGLPLFESLAQLHLVLLPFIVRCGAAAICGGSSASNAS